MSWFEMVQLLVQSWPADQSQFKSIVRNSILTVRSYLIFLHKQIANVPDPDTVNLDAA